MHKSVPGTIVTETRFFAVDKVVLPVTIRKNG